MLKNKNSAALLLKKLIKFQTKEISEDGETVFCCAWDIFQKWYAASVFVSILFLHRFASVFYYFHFNETITIRQDQNGTLWAGWERERGDLSNEGGRINQYKPEALWESEKCGTGKLIRFWVLFEKRFYRTVLTDSPVR